MKNENKVKPFKLRVDVFEIFENGKKIKEVKSWEALENYESKRFNALEKQGYKQLEKSSAGYTVYVNYQTQQCVFYAYRIWNGLYDCEGKRIYDGDRLEDKFGNTVDIQANWDYTTSKRDGTFTYRKTVGVGYRQHTADIPVYSLEFIKEDGVRVAKNCFEFFG